MPFYSPPVMSRAFRLQSQRLRRGPARRLVGDRPLPAPLVSLLCRRPTGPNPCGSKSIPPPGINEHAWRYIGAEAIGQPIAVTKCLARLAASWASWVASGFRLRPGENAHVLVLSPSETPSNAAVYRPSFPREPGRASPPLCLRDPAHRPQQRRRCPVAALVRSARAAARGSRKHERRCGVRSPLSSTVNQSPST